MYSYAGGGLSISREADVYPNDGTRHNKSWKQDVEEIEAHRASFGFSTDEIVMTQNYVELSEPLDESFMMSPFADGKTGIEQYSITEIDDTGKRASNLLDPMSPNQMMAHLAVGVDCKSDQNNMHAGVRPQIQSGDTSPLAAGSPNTDCGVESDSRTSNHQPSLASELNRDNCSDAEIDHRRARSLRETNALMAWGNSLPYN
ncbi:unnamed protein product [Musa hybrid cultivar]